MRIRTKSRVLRAILPKAVLATFAHHTDISAGIATAVGASRLVLPSGARVFLGCALAETAGATAKIRFHDGTGNTAVTGSKGVLMPITFAANGSADIFFPDEAVEVISGAVYLEVVSGSVEGVIFWG